MINDQERAKINMALRGLQQRENDGPVTAMAHRIEGIPLSQAMAPNSGTGLRYGVSDLARQETMWFTNERDEALAFLKAGFLVSPLAGYRGPLGLPA